MNFMWGLALCGIAAIIGPVSAYAIDAIQDLSNDIFIAKMVFKNVLFFVNCYFVNDWVARAGPAIPLNIDI